MAGIERGTPSGEPTAQQPKSTEQRKPHQEGGNGSLGLPPTVHEHAKPPPNSPAYEGSESTSVQKRRAEGTPSVEDVLLPKLPPAVFDSIIPEINREDEEAIIESIVKNGLMTEEEALRLKERWLKKWPIE